VAALIVSICAVGLTLYEGMNQRWSYKEQVYQGFVNIWFEIDRLFIEQPHMRKYFYNNAEISSDDKDFDLAMSIAEFFDDAFAYSESQAMQIPHDLKSSYEDYKKKIRSMNVLRAYKDEYEWVNNHEKES